MLPTADRRAGERSSMDNFTPVSALLGGVLIGLASVWLLAANGRIAGISGIVHGIFAPPQGWRDARAGPHEARWQAWFVSGLLVAGLAWQASGAPVPLREGFPLGW